MDIKKLFIALIFFVPLLFVVGFLMAVFGVVGSFTYGLAFAATGSAGTAALLSGVMGLVLVAAIRHGIFRRLPFKRLTLKDIYGFYIAMFVGFMASPYLATAILSHFSNMQSTGWSMVLNYVLSGFVPVALMLVLDKLGICKLPSWDTTQKSPWDRFKK